MPAGRPTKMTPEVLGYLVQAFGLGCTDIEACLYANISVDVLYDYQKKNPEFAKRKAALKETPVLIARTVVVNDIWDDANLAFKYLERKRKDEFGPVNKIEAEVKTEHDLSPALASMFNKVYKGEDK